MARNLTRQLVDAHLVEGRPTPGEEVALRIDQTLTQDATGTLVMLQLEAMGLPGVKTELSVQYVDHNLLQQDHRNPDDHLFLRSACRRFGLWYSPAGNGISHPLHQERFGRPGTTLLGSDSHTCAAGAIGMLAIGAGGIDVALAMAGRPFRMRMPEIWGIRLSGRLPDWVSAKDVILELLRRHGVDGGRNKILEYHGPGVANLPAMDRHVIANMGAELGATSSVFPSDEMVRGFLASQNRELDWRPLCAEPGSTYDVEDEVALDDLEPLIAMPSSPGNVERVADVAGQPIHQAYLGSSANPGYRDFAMVAELVRDRVIPDHVSFDVNPTSRQLLVNLVETGHLGVLLQAGARIHQAGCNGCIGMGQAPATDRISLRTTPRNFPGRSGTREDRVCLVSPETLAASALNGCISDPREQDRAYPHIEEQRKPTLVTGLFVPPASERSEVEAPLVKGPNIVSLPRLDPLPPKLELTVALVLADHVSTDEILPAGTRVLPFRSNIPAISRFTFESVDANYVERADRVRDAGGHAIVAGDNYGQGSSREHAALAPRFLGLRLVLARSFARIHRQNLLSYGVLPLRFREPSSLSDIEVGDVLTVRWDDPERSFNEPRMKNETRGIEVPVCLDVNARETRVLRLGGAINAFGNES